MTRTITRCEKNARAEVCFWREEQNGQVNERYNVRGWMDGWLATCKVLDIIDRAYILHEGQVLMEGPPAEIVAHEGVRRVYLGDRFSL